MVTGHGSNGPLFENLIVLIIIQAVMSTLKRGPLNAPELKE